MILFASSPVLTPTNDEPARDPYLSTSRTAEPMAKAAADSTMSSSPTATGGGKRYVLIGKSRVTGVPPVKAKVGKQAKSGSSVSK